MILLHHDLELRKYWQMRCKIKILKFSVDPKLKQLKMFPDRKSKNKWRGIRYWNNVWNNGGIYVWLLYIGLYYIMWLADIYMDLLQRLQLLICICLEAKIFLNNLFLFCFAFVTWNRFSKKKKKKATKI